MRPCDARACNGRKRMALSPQQRTALVEGLGGIFSALDGSFLGIGNFVVRVLTAFLNAKNALLHIQSFDFDPRFKTRVISLPRAEEGITELWNTIRLDLLGKYQEINADVHNLLDTFRAGDISDSADIEGHISGLAKGAVQLHNLKTFLEGLGTSIEHVADLLSIIEDIKRRIETLDDLFLPQGSTKKTVDKHYRSRKDV